MKTPLTKEQGRAIVHLLLAGMVCLMLVVGYVWYSGYSDRQQTVHNQRAGCERGKQDRKDNADFQNAHSKYIEKVVIAGSVEEDVKRAAREALETYQRTAPSLTARSKIDCSTAFPDAELFSW